MLGPYPARHASANFAASRLTAFFLASASTSRATEDRQSTTVPKVSKTSAFAAIAGVTARPAPCAPLPVLALAMTMVPA